MRPAFFVLFAVYVQGVAQPTSGIAALPWLSNFSGVAVESSEPGKPARVEDEPGCAAGAYAQLKLTAEIAPAAGAETIVASLAGGMTIKSAEGTPIASMPGYPCDGSGDELEVLAVGYAFQLPTIVLAFTSGGHRMQITWLGVYRLGLAGRIEAVFAGVVEEREDGVVRRGSVTFLPGALLHRRPSGAATLWVRDPIGGAYVPRGRFDHEAEPRS